VDDRQRRAVLEAAQAHVLRLRAALAEPVDTARLRAEAAEELAGLATRRTELVATLSKLEPELSELGVQAARAAEELERLKFPREPSSSLPAPVLAVMLVGFAAAWWALDDAASMVPDPFQRLGALALLGGSMTGFALRAWRWGRQSALWR
jgi:16S rRNA C967 or C1407 C5-methylase (RsmB/RsmF family)